MAWQLIIPSQQVVGTTNTTNQASFFAPLLPLKLGSNLCGCCKSFVSSDFLAMLLDILAINEFFSGNHISSWPK